MDIYEIQIQIQMGNYLFARSNSIITAGSANWNFEEKKTNKKNTHTRHFTSSRRVLRQFTYTVFEGSVLLPQDSPGYPRTPRTHKDTQRYLYSIIFTMFLCQIRFIFIEFVIKSKYNFICVFKYNLINLRFMFMFM